MSTKSPDQGQCWTWVNNFLVTCDDEGNVPINSKIVAEVVIDSITKGNKALISSAPELLSVLDDLFNGTRMEMSPAMNNRVVAVLRKARGL